MKHFPKWNIYDDPVASFDYVPVYKSVIYFTTHLSASCLAAKHPKTQRVEEFPHPRKTIGLSADTGRGVCLHNDLACLDSFAKISVSVWSFFNQGIIYMNRNGNVCEGTRVWKIIAETKVGARVGQWKKLTGFSRMSVMANLLCFGCFTAG